MSCFLIVAVNTLTFCTR